MDLSLETLPPEQSEQSVMFVPPQDLCNLVLTSSSMRTLASDPKLWSEMKVKQSKIRQEGLKKLFAIKRFSKIRSIDLSGIQFTTKKLLANLNAIATSSVQDLNLEYVDISQVPAQLLVEVAVRLHKMSLAWTLPTSEQITAVLEACVSSTTLVDVSLEYIDLHEVPSQLLANAAKHLHRINLNITNLTSEQSTAILEACVASTKLVEVNLWRNDLHEVPAQLLVDAAKHLHKMHLGQTRLNTEKIIAVLEACISSSELVDVNLRDNYYLHKVPCQLLADAAKQLHKMHLDDSNLTSEQIIAVLEACISSTKLVEVSLGCNDFRGVPAQLLADAAKHLHVINLNSSILTSEQIIAVLEACVCSTKLVDVNLSGNDLHEVPAQLLAEAAKHFHRMNLTWNRQTSEQIIAVLEACVSSTKLVEVNLCHNDLSGVPAQLLADAAKHLHKMHLSYSNLTSEQIIAVLKTCISTTTLVEVNLGGNDLDNVPIELQVQAVDTGPTGYPLN